MADKSSTNFFTNLTNGLQAPVAKAEDTFNGKDMRGAAIVYGVAGIALGSVFGRQRAAAGKEPVLKVFF